MRNRRCICGQHHPENEVFLFKDGDTKPYPVALKTAIEKYMPYKFFDFTPDGDGRLYCGRSHYDDSVLGLKGHLSTPKTRDTLDESNVPLEARVDVQNGDFPRDRHVGKFFVVPTQFEGVLPPSESAPPKKIGAPSDDPQDEDLDDPTVSFHQEETPTDSSFAMADQSLQPLITRPKGNDHAPVPSDSVPPNENGIGSTQEVNDAFNLDDDDLTAFVHQQNNLTDSSCAMANNNREHHLLQPPTIQPTDNDVLLGAGWWESNHPGNVAFRSVAERGAARYRSLELSQRAEYAFVVLQELRAKGVRFLEMDEETKIWNDIGDGEAGFMIRHTLRKIMINNIERELQELPGGFTERRSERRRSEDVPLLYSDSSLPNGNRNNRIGYTPPSHNSSLAGDLGSVPEGSPARSSGVDKKGGYIPKRRTFFPARFRSLDDVESPLICTIQAFDEHGPEWNINKPDYVAPVNPEEEPIYEEDETLPWYEMEPSNILPAHAWWSDSDVEWEFPDFPPGDLPDPVLEQPESSDLPSLYSVDSEKTPSDTLHGRGGWANNYRETGRPKTFRNEPNSLPLDEDKFKYFALKLREKCAKFIQSVNPKLSSMASAYTEAFQENAIAIQQAITSCAQSFGQVLDADYFQMINRTVNFLGSKMVEGFQEVSHRNNFPPILQSLMGVKRAPNIQYNDDRHGYDTQGPRASKIQKRATKRYPI